MINQDKDKWTGPQLIVIALLCLATATPLMFAVDFACGGHVVNWVIFSNMSYQEHIDVETYIVPEKDIQPFFSHDVSEFPASLSNMQLWQLTNEGHTLYLIVRARNKGSLSAFYTQLDVTVNRHFSIPFWMTFGRNNDSYYAYAVSIDSSLVKDDGLHFDQPPSIETSWAYLYTK